MTVSNPQPRVFLRNKVQMPLDVDKVQSHRLRFLCVCLAHHCAPEWMATGCLSADLADVSGAIKCLPFPHRSYRVTGIPVSRV